MCVNNSLGRTRLRGEMDEHVEQELARLLEQMRIKGIPMGRNRFAPPSAVSARRATAFATSCNARKRSARGRSVWKLGHASTAHGRQCRQANRQSTSSSSRLRAGLEYNGPMDLVGYALETLAVIEDGE
jgi:hypothetical protein